MQCRTYQSNSLEESAGILSREWSGHRLSSQKGEAFRLHFSIRSLTEHMSLSRLAYGTQVLVRPEERADVLLLQMPRSGAGVVSYDWGNTPLDTRHYALINVQKVTQVHYGREVDMSVLRISLPRVMNQLELLLGRKASQQISFEPYMTYGSDAWNAWAPVSAALEVLELSPLGNFPASAMEALEAMVLNTLLMTQPHNYRDELSTPRKGARQVAAPRHVRIAEELIHASLDRVLTTDEIASHAGVSVRTLFDGFREFRQTSPAIYAREVRLEGARRELLRGVESIADIAARWGFPHAGHFAAQYRRKYGESPGETARLHSTIH